MQTKYSAEGIDVAEATEFSLGLALVLAVAVFLGVAAFRDAGAALAHRPAYAMHVTETVAG